MEISIHPYISVIGILISITALILAYLRFSNDNPNLEFSCEVHEQSVRITIFNTGRRPIFIKAIGVYEWTDGTHHFRENERVDTLLNEAEHLTVNEPYNLTDLWKIKKFVALDYNNKIWSSTKKQLKQLYEIAHTVRDGYILAEYNPKKISKDKKRRKNKIEKSIKEYKKFTKKNKLNPRI